LIYNIWAKAGQTGRAYKNGDMCYKPVVDFVLRLLLFQKTATPGIWPRDALAKRW
jgi:hypothetical protein